jgi:hypothetical protein
MKTYTITYLNKNTDSILTIDLKASSLNDARKQFQNSIWGKKTIFIAVQ